MRSQIEIAVAAALSVNLSFYRKFTRRDSGGSPNPFNPGEAGLPALVPDCYSRRRVQRPHTRTAAHRPQANKGTKVMPSLS